MRALLSAYDRTGLVDFAKVLAASGFELLSTGGTANELKNAGLSITEVSSVSGAPEILDGRVKTLHPRIHGGILGKRNNPAHVAEMEEQGIEGIDVVVNNLYPFQKTIAKPDVTLDDALENIDIGGPAMVRSASKNFERVTCIVDPASYTDLATELRASGGQLGKARRFELARAAFAHVAHYDVAIRDYLDGVNAGEL